jgi:hypothetical protein
MRDWKVDWFSAAAMFPGWAEYAPYEDEPFLWRGPRPTIRSPCTSPRRGSCETEEVRADLLPRGSLGEAFIGGPAAAGLAVASETPCGSASAPPRAS